MPEVALDSGPDVAANLNGSAVDDAPTKRDERLIVAPSAGRYVPLPAEVFTTEGEWVEIGTAVGEIHNGGNRIPVRSGVRGWVMGSPAVPGQPVTKDDVLLWIREV